MSPLRVLMFGWEFPPHVAGGLATATVGLVKGLARNDVEVTLVVPFRPGEAPHPGLRLVGADGPGPVRRHLIETPLEAYGGEREYREALAGHDGGGGRPGDVYGRDLLAEVERYASLAAGIAARERHDVIDAHDWITFEAGLAARAVSGKPLVLHIHATEHDRQSDGANAEICERERRALAAADRVIANSYAIRETCVQRYGIPRDRIDVVHWGIDPDGLPDPGPLGSPLRGHDGERPPTVLFLGRVTRQKGPDIFVEVAGRVAQHVPDARYVIAGRGDLLPRVIERVAELGIADRVFFTGGVGGEQVTRLYRMADVCVMPSVSEPFGLVALESVREGTPVVVPRASGVAEVLRNAFKVDFWDVDAMTNLVVGLLRHPQLARQLSDNGREEIDEPRFGLDEPARRTRDVYTRVLAGTTP